MLPYVEVPTGAGSRGTGQVHAQAHQAVDRDGAGAMGRPRLACMADAARQAVARREAEGGEPSERSSRCRMAAGHSTPVLPRRRAGAARMCPGLPKTSSPPAGQRVHKDDPPLGFVHEDKMLMASSPKNNLQKKNRMWYIELWLARQPHYIFQLFSSCPAQHICVPELVIRRIHHVM